MCVYKIILIILDIIVSLTMSTATKERLNDEKM